MINNEWGFITFPTHTDPEQRAIARLKIASEMSLEHYKTPLLLTHSGGKDSCVLTELALRAEIPFEVLHAHTTAEAVPPTWAAWRWQPCPGLPTLGPAMRWTPGGSVTSMTTSSFIKGTAAAP